MKTQAQAIDTPDSAIEAARAAWESIDSKNAGAGRFSKESIARFEPYKATLSDGVWTVRGTTPDGREGGPTTTVRADNGQVMVGFIAEPPPN
jgi:hypothetical protein